MFKALIFDMDGVLIDSEPLHKKIEQDILKELGVNLPLEEHYQFVSMGKIMWDIVEKRYGFNRKTTADELHQEKATRYLEALTSKPILPIKGLEELLSGAKEKGLILAIASSSSVHNIDLVVKALGIKRYFSLIVSGDHVTRNKPFPDIYLKAAELLDLLPEACIVIDDSSNGVKAAKNAGMYCIGFNNPGSGNQDMSPADVIVNSLREVIKLI